MIFNVIYVRNNKDIFFYSILLCSILFYNAQKQYRKF